VAGSVGKDDTAGFHWMHCSCGQHWRYITIKGAHKTQHALICKVCPGGENRLQKPGLEAAQVLAQQHCRWAYECRVLRETYGPIDFYLPDLKLGAEVDGEQHYGRAMYGESYKVIQGQDTRKCGIRILRVPYFHASDFHKKLAEAVDECIAHPSSMFIMWSTDTLNEFGCFARLGGTIEELEARMRGARESAEVRPPSPFALKGVCPRIPFVPVMNVMVWGPTA